MEGDRDRDLVRAFVDLADTLVADYDVVDLLTTLATQCCDLLGAADAGILLAGADGQLMVAAASSERGHRVSVVQFEAGEGPCVDSYGTGATVAVRGQAALYARWPGFAVAAQDFGYESVHAVPLRLRDDVLGSLNLFFDSPEGLSDEDAAIARGLADVAAISILHERALSESTIVRDQLQRALDSRVLIEQAKGIIAVADQVDMDEAFHRLRARARSTSARISEAAREIILRSVGRGDTDGRPGSPAT